MWGRCCMRLAKKMTGSFNPDVLADPRRFGLWQEMGGNGKMRNDPIRNRWASEDRLFYKLAWPGRRDRAHTNI